MLCRIIVAIVLWAAVTCIVFLAIQKYKSERASLFGGAFFLVVAIVAALLLPVLIGVQDSCNTYACLRDKDMVNALVTFFIISWGAFGANLLSSCISHK
jgi:hypothetical protein